MNSVIIATDCPSCGAPLDFTEGSNAVTCGHCKSNLLVTGRKQLLSYSVSPRLDEHKAAAIAVMAQRNMGRSDFRGISARLYFVPYYRMTGQDFSWEKPRPKPMPEEEDFEKMGPGAFGPPITRRSGSSVLGGWTSLLDAAVELMENLFGGSSETGPERREEFCFTTPERSRIKQVHSEKAGADNNPRQPCKSSLYEKGDVLLNDRYIEKNFLACDLHGAGLFSLGVRPSVLRLELFRPEALKAVGKIVHPAMTPDEAEAVGLKTAPDNQLLFRKVIGKMLSLVYFPFWFVEMESMGTPLVTVIDAVSEAVVKDGAPVSLHKTLDMEFRDTPRVVGFRPLTCPNCGWDFPVRPDNTIFFCKTCSTAWQLCESDLSEVSYEVADAINTNDACSVQYLPFWILDMEPKKQQKHFRFFMPAFRYRRLKFLLDLGLKISRLQPSYEVVETKDIDLTGCYYDTDDAVQLARFVKAVLWSRGIGEFRTKDHDMPALSGATLTWVPFRVNGAYLSSPFGQISIPRNLLQQ